MSLGSQVFPGTTALSVLLLLMTASVTAAPRGEIPLHDAINDGDWDRFTGLLQAGRDPNEVNGFGQTALHFALVRLYGRGYLYVSELLNFGADPDAKDRTGATALHHAAMIGWPAIASLLLRNGADVHARSHGGGSPLGSAYIHGYMDIVRLLESYGARIDIEAKRRQLMAVSLINAVVRRCARKTKDDTAGAQNSLHSTSTARNARETRALRPSQRRRHPPHCSRGGLDNRHRCVRCAPERAAEMKKKAAFRASGFRISGFCFRITNHESRVTNHGLHLPVEP